MTEGVAPILPSRDLRATSASYRRLGYVDDADALHEQYAAVGLPGEGIPRLHGPPRDADQGLREFAVVDEDGNLLSIGSPLPQAG